MPHRQTEPRRAPKTELSAGDRTGAGCLGLFTLPWAAAALFGAFASAGAPLTMGAAGFISGIFMLLLLVPMIMVLGSVTWSALRTASGQADRVEIYSKTAGGSLAASVVAIFAFSTLLALVRAFGGAVGGSTIEIANMLGAFAGMGVLGVGGYMASKQMNRDRKRKRQRERRRHDQRPQPPWNHPLARTEAAGMITEAVTNQYNVIALFTAVALSVILWNPLPAMVAGGLELFYLALVPDMKWFQRYVDADHLAWAEELAKERREEQLEYLTGEQLALHEQMVATANAARGALEASDYPFELAKVDRVVDHHLWLMELENYYRDLDDVELRTDLQEKIANVERQKSDATGRMVEVLEQRANVLERRLGQLERITDHVEEIREQRLGLEDALRLLSESALGAGPTSSDEIDEVLLHLEVTEEVVLDFHSAEEELEEQIEAAAAAAGVSA